MSKLSIAAAIATLFLLLGPYVGVRLFGTPQSTLIEPQSNNRSRTFSNDYTDRSYYDSSRYQDEQDDMMEPIPADEFSVE